MRGIAHLVAGKPFVGTSSRTGPVYNPATGLRQAEVALATAEDVDRIVAVSQSAFESWSRTSLQERTRLLFTFRELLYARKDDVAALITAEHGKVRSDALGEVTRGLENVEFACGAVQALQGRYSHQVAKGVDVWSFRQPLGVVAGITPFNFPAMVPLWMLATALVCGNTFVLKPSERDPSASLLLVSLLDEAGLPPGVCNVVHGDKVAVDRLIEHPAVQALSFVGSTPVARYVYERGTDHGKRVQALGGAKNHMVVMPDADVSVAADAAVSAGFGSAGERCMAISIVVAVGDVADPLVDAISVRISDLRVGPGDDPGSQMGPLITSDHRDRVAGYVAGAVDEGATLVVDGRRLTPDLPGYFLGPSLVDHITPEMAVYRDEIFGPVLGVVRVETFDDALKLVNGSPYGNGAVVFTRDGSVARRFQVEADAGMIGVNVPIPVPVASYSFGGWKSSLFGDTHMYGPEGIEFFTRAKVVTSRWPEVSSSRIDLGFSP